ncbi:6314_t:CDS:2 [Ambispora gerdemannii]|uniref:6314_t:CDS:1 n=1 Tax=Ambispora gerdemannii TaxID=144530 RepID=A0A9N8UVX2_9GLOM|nr:6314_t:CDS:2 [Ambispora gerdemannii]
MNLGSIQETSPGSTPSTSSNSSTTSLNTTQNANNNNISSNSNNNGSSSGALSNSLPERNEAWSTTLQQTQTSQQQQPSSSPYRTPSIYPRSNSGNSNSSTNSSIYNQSSASFYPSERNQTISSTTSSQFSGYSLNTHEKSHSTGSIPANIKDSATSTFTSTISQPTMSFSTPHRNHPFEISSDYYNSKVDAIKDKSGLHDGWLTLCINVLPLFNGEGLKMSIEDLNELLRGCIRDKTTESLYNDIIELLASGMSTLNSKLRDVPDEKLVSRLNELWSFYFGTVIPYFEGVFLPLQIQANNSTTATINALSHNSVNSLVRRMVLMSFRDQVILPMGDRVDEAFNKLFHDFDSGIPVADTAARMLQMTYILSSILSNDEKQTQMDRILAKLKNNWKLFMRRDRRGFIGIPSTTNTTTNVNMTTMTANTSAASSPVEYSSAVTTPTTPTPNVAGVSGTVAGIGVSATTSPSQ